jgi:hypothetical protein
VIDQRIIDLSLKPKPCEWCGALATTRVIATDACASCAEAEPKERVGRALQRWKRSAGR